MLPIISLKAEEKLECLKKNLETLLKVVLKGKKHAQQKMILRYCDVYMNFLSSVFFQMLKK